MTCTNMEALGRGVAGGPTPPDRRQTAQDRTRGGHPVSAASSPSFQRLRKPAAGPGVLLAGIFTVELF